MDVIRSEERLQEIEEPIDQVFEITETGGEVLKKRTRRASRSDGSALVAQEVYDTTGGQATVVRESVVVETSRGRTPQEWKEKCEMKEVVEEKKIVGEDGKEQAVKVTIEEKVFEDGKV